MDKVTNCFESLNIDLSNTWVKVALGTTALVGSSLVVSKIVSARGEAKLREKWNSVPQNTVVLHQFHRCYTCPNPSPFVLKLETYLRMAKIPYEVDFEQPLGPLGKSPWITFNGKDYPDSQLIIELLNDKLNVDLDKNLTEEQKAIAHSTRRLLEASWIWPFALDRWVYSKQDFSKWLYLPIPRFLQKIMFIRFGAGVKKIGDLAGVTKFGRPQVEKFGLQDLKALSVLLGNKAYMFGDEPTEVDCTVFGMTTMSLYASQDSSPFKIAIETEYTNLKEHNARMKERFYPDWEELKTKRN